MRVPTPTTPALAAAIAALAPLTAAEKIAAGAHTATEKEGMTADAAFKGALEQIGATGLSTREEIIAFVAGDPAQAAGPLAALKRLQAAERAEARAYKVWQRCLGKAERAADALLKIPAADPAEALAKVAAFMEVNGLPLAKLKKVPHWANEETIYLAFLALVRDLTTAQAPTPPTPAGVSPELATLADRRGAIEANLRRPDFTDTDRTAACGELHPVELAMFAFAPRTVADAVVKLEMAAQTLDEGGFVGAGDEADTEVAVMREVAAFLRSGPQGPDPVAEELTAAEKAHPGDDEDDDARWGQYFRLLDAPVSADPTTLRGIAWRLAKISDLVESVEDREGGKPDASNRINAEAHSIMRGLLRMGVQSNGAILGCFATVDLLKGDPLRQYRLLGYDVHARCEGGVFSYYVASPTDGLEIDEAVFAELMSDENLPAVKATLQREFWDRVFDEPGAARNRDEVKALWEAGKATPAAPRLIGSSDPAGQHAALLEAMH